MAASLTSTDLTLDNTSGASIPGTPSAGQTVLYPKADKLLYYKDDAGVERLVNVTAAVTPINLGTAVATTSGTSIDFTGIPAGVKRITLGVAGLSTNGGAELLIQIGSSAGVKTSGYLGFATYTGSATAGLNMGAGFTVRSDDAGEVQHGIINLTAIDTAAGNWAMSAILGRSNESYMAISGGAASLSAMLTSVRLTTTNGTDAFDAGLASISWEF